MLLEEAEGSLRSTGSQLHPHGEIHLFASVADELMPWGWDRHSSQSQASKRVPAPSTPSPDPIRVPPMGVSPSVSWGNSQHGWWVTSYQPQILELLRGLTCAQLGTCRHEVYLLNSHSRDFLVWGRAPLLAELQVPSEPSTGLAEGLVTSVQGRLQWPQHPAPPHLPSGQTHRLCVGCCVAPSPKPAGARLLPPSAGQHSPAPTSSARPFLHRCVPSAGLSFPG